MIKVKGNKIAINKISKGGPGNVKAKDMNGFQQVYWHRYIIKTVMFFMNTLVWYSLC